MKIVNKMLSRIARLFLRNDPEFQRMQQLTAQLDNVFLNSTLASTALLQSPYKINDCSISAYSYVAENSKLSMVTIGKFCSIGPNLFAGYGIHPTHGISTSPMFYSTLKQNGVSLSKKNKIEERKPIIIGNDVFIGANVTILDGITIADGAVIGAGAVVSKDVPPYAIVVGCPMQIVKYRFTDEQIKKLLKIKWWDLEQDKLPEVEKYFFNIDEFIAANSHD